MSIAETPQDRAHLPCSCGQVEMNVHGLPIASVVCYCDTCQEGSRAIEALPNAEPICDPAGGTAYVAYRKDRVSYAKGTELLRPLKIDATATSRVYATCCNSPMVMKFDDARHWVSIYAGRFRPQVPALDYRICTKFAPADAEIPRDVPNSAMYPPGLMLKLLKAKIGMVFGPH